MPTRKVAWLGPRTEALLHNASAFVAGTAVSQLVLTVALIYTARHLGIAAFGQYSAVFALIGILSAFASYGLDTWLLREGGRAPERLPELIGDLLVVKLILAIVWSSSIALISSLVRLPVFPSHIVRIALVWGIGETFSLLAYAAFRAKLQHKVAAMLQAFNTSLLLILTIVLAYNHAQLIDLVWARSLVSLLGVVVSWSIAAMLIGIRFHRPHVAAYLRSASPFAASDFLSGLYLKADVTLVAFFLGQAAAGIYAPAVAILNTLFVVPNAAYTVMLPTLSNLHRTDDPLLRIAARRMQLVLVFVGLTIMTGLALFAHPLILLLYGSAFAASGTVLVILSAILFFKSLSFGLAALLTAVGQQARRVVAQFISAVTNVGLNLVLIPQYGVIAAALVYVISEMVLWLVYTYLVRRVS